MTNEQFWLEVQSKYPKSHNAFLEFMYPHHAVVRDLYDFFDAKGITLSVEPDTFHNDGSITFSGTIWNADESTDTYTPERDTRTEAESAAFEKAFSILENQIAEGEE